MDRCICIAMVIQNHSTKDKAKQKKLSYAFIKWECTFIKKKRKERNIYILSQEYDMSMSCLYSPVDIMFILQGLMKVIAQVQEWEKKSVSLLFS